MFDHGLVVAVAGAVAILVGVCARILGVSIGVSAPIAAIGFAAVVVGSIVVGCDFIRSARRPKI